MFTIGEYAQRAMIMAYRDMRSDGILPNGSLSGGYGPLNYGQNEILRVRITVNVAAMANAANRNSPFAWHLIPLIEDMAYAMAQTEQHRIGSDRYNAWRDYEITLHNRALKANR